jgi:hypothetical protein
MEAWVLTEEFPPNVVASCVSPQPGKICRINPCWAKEVEGIQQTNRARDQKVDSYRIWPLQGRLSETPLHTSATQLSVYGI